ncbi:hypothetical protein SAMN04488136_1647 [Vibrio xiamenensis]|uniref:Uncharacterized protein n=1 Tax=Vibrio xiamenensis TaxID=861298 RepID=A0A1G8HUF7_9VIBR|nr:hypothetical protein [Vibrio xiamenensis]SDI10279.1 hypothetical protein SAMN04488136_1647 [Vibrio xiamenensis]
MYDQVLEITEGRTCDFSLLWETEDENRARTPVDLTDAIIELEIRKSSDDSLLLRLSSEDGEITIAEPTTGESQYHIAPSQTEGQAAENWRDALWEVLVTFPSLDKYAIASGQARLIRGIVQSRT